jgi:peptidoglycan glycosyltransferase
MNTFLLLLIDWSKLRPENIFGGQVVERTPAGLTIVYSIGVGVLLVILLISFLENFRRPKLIFERGLPREVNRKIAQTRANRSLLVWLSVFVLLAFFVFGFQVYWTRYADDTNEQFQALSYKDLRNRRINAASLRGWMLDRTGKLDAALAYYKVEKDGSIKREFPLDKEMAHLLGNERGSPGLERTLYKKEADPMPEAWEILTKYKKPEPENKDVRISIDKDLQTYAAKLLEGKNGAIVVLNPQNGDVLAMYSNPSFSLDEVQTSNGYLKLEGNKRDKPLLSRATREYYMPGSTFKTVTMMTAFRTGRQGILLPDAPGGYVPFAGSRAIHDANGDCELCQPQVAIRQAYQMSLNQVFAKMANELGRERMGETARLLGIATVDDPDDAGKQGYFPDIWNVSDRRIAASLAPARSAIVTGKGISLYDFGLEGMGQGLASQMTPFQMALVAATAGNLQGFLIKPKIEADLPPQPFNKVLTPEQGAAIRDIMSTVTQEGGTAGTAIQKALGGTNISTGGKTGTANKSGVPIYDSPSERRFILKKEKGANGEIVEQKVYLSRDRVDGWFICIAPLENPQVAIAVVIEDIGGHAAGGTTAAPIAANVILKAAELGLLGDRYRSVAAPRQSVRKKK